MRVGVRTIAMILAFLLVMTVGSAINTGGATATPALAAEGAARFGSLFRHGDVAVDGGAVHYVIGGTGPPLVLLHGWPQTWWEWRLVMPRLARDHTIIAIDLPGLGDSGRPPGGYDDAGIPTGGYDKVTTARRVRDAVRQLGFDRVTIMGHDIGSMVAYRYARDFPGEVDRLIILDTLLFGFGGEDEFKFSWHYLFNAARPGFPEEIVDDDDVAPFYGYFFDGASHRPGRIDSEEYFRVYADPEIRSAGFDYYRTWPVDVADNQAGVDDERLSIPLLAMGGQYLYGSRVAEVYRQVADDVREVIAPDSGHWIPEENPRFLIDCVRAFLGDTHRHRFGAEPELAACGY